MKKISCIKNNKRLEQFITWLNNLKERENNNLPNDIYSGGLVIKIKDQDSNKSEIKDVLVQFDIDFTYIKHEDIFNFYNSKSFKNIYKSKLFIFEAKYWLIASKNKSLIALQEKFKNFLTQARKNNFFVVCIVNSISDIPTHLKKVGFLDQFIEIDNKSSKLIGTEFINKIGKNLCDFTILSHPKKIGKLIDVENKDNNEISLIIKFLQRKSLFTKKLLCLSDIFEVFFNGPVDFSNASRFTKDYLNSIAVHEAGHIVISIIDSNGENIPDYATATPGREYSGIVINSYNFLEKYHKHMTYKNYIHQIRIDLAGRGAEHLINGYENITLRTSDKDLESATRLCNDLFMYSGISVKKTNINEITEKLSVKVNNLSEEEVSLISRLTRDLLRKQYIYVYDLLSKHKRLLETFIESLKKNKYLCCDDIKFIYSKYISER